MPELPEVQTVVDDLVAAGLEGRTITDVRINWPGSIAGNRPKRFRQALIGRRADRISRRAKYIVWHLNGPLTMLTHLRMTGRFHLAVPHEAFGKHDHLAFTFDEHLQLRYQDTRKFGRFYIEDSETILGRLGPEPLARQFSARLFEQRLASRRRQLKPLLLDQQFIAGLGNIYVDEALWDAGLSPTRSSDTLDSGDIRRLHRAVRKVLRRGLRNMGTTLGTGETTFYSVAGNRGRNKEDLKVFRRTGEPCPRCRTPVKRLVVGQRSTHICPACQK
jgi:formamidopyrimidine-DNA glycosylase